jgi:hypothetical protein
VDWSARDSEGQAPIEGDWLTLGKDVAKHILMPIAKKAISWLGAAKVAEALTGRKDPSGGQGGSTFTAVPDGGSEATALPAAVPLDELIVGQESVPEGYIAISPSFVKTLALLGQEFQRRMDDRVFDSMIYFGGDPVAALTAHCTPAVVDRDGRYTYAPTHQAANVLAGGALWDKIKNWAKTKVAPIVAKVAPVVSKVASWISPGLGTLVGKGVEAVGKWAESATQDASAEATPVPAAPAPEGSALASAGQTQVAQGPDAAVQQSSLLKFPYGTTLQQMNASSTVAQLHDTVAEAVKQAAENLGVPIKGAAVVTPALGSGRVLTALAAPVASLRAKLADHGLVMSGDGVSEEEALTTMFSVQEGELPKPNQTVEVEAAAEALESVGPAAVTTDEQGKVDSGLISRISDVFARVATLAADKRFGWSAAAGGRILDAAVSLIAPAAAGLLDRRRQRKTKVAAEADNRLIIAGVAEMAHDPARYARPLAAAVTFGPIVVENNDESRKFRQQILALADILPEDLSKSVEQWMAQPGSLQAAKIASADLSVAALADVAYMIGARKLEDVPSSRSDAAKSEDFILSSFTQSEGEAPLAAQVAVEVATSYLNAADASGMKKPEAAVAEADKVWAADKAADASAGVIAVDSIRKDSAEGADASGNGAPAAESSDAGRTASDKSNASPESNEQHTLERILNGENVDSTHDLTMTKQDEEALKSPGLWRKISDLWNSSTASEKFIEVLIAAGLTAAAAKAISKMRDRTTKQADTTAAIFGTTGSSGVGEAKRTMLIPVMGTRQMYREG